MFLKYITILVILFIFCSLNYLIVYKQKYTILIIICVIIFAVGFYFCLGNRSLRHSNYAGNPSYSNYMEHFDTSESSRDTKMIYYDVCLKSNSYICRHTKSAEEFIYFKNIKINKKNEIQIKFEEIYLEEETKENVIKTKERIGEQFGVRGVESFPLVISYVYGKQNQILPNQTIKGDNLHTMFDRIKIEICNLVCPNTNFKHRDEFGYKTTENSMIIRDKNVLKENKFRSVNEKSPIIFA